MAKNSPKHNSNKNNSKDNTKRMLIDAAHIEETRVAIVEGDRLEEFDYESSMRKALKGSIFLAKVTRVEPSLQAAFVNFGGNRHGFLPFSEIHPDYFRIPIADREALMAEQEEELKALEEAEEEEEQEDVDGDATLEAEDDAAEDAEEADGEIEEVGGELSEQDSDQQGDEAEDDGDNVGNRIDDEEIEDDEKVGNASVASEIHIRSGWVALRSNVRLRARPLEFHLLHHDGRTRGAIGARQHYQDP